MYRTKKKTWGGIKNPGGYQIQPKPKPKTIFRDSGKGQRPPIPQALSNAGGGQEASLELDFQQLDTLPYNNDSDDDDDDDDGTPPLLCGLCHDPYKIGMYQFYNTTMHTLIRGKFRDLVASAVVGFTIYAFFHVESNGVVQVFNFHCAIITKNFVLNGTIFWSHLEQHGCAIICTKFKSTNLNRRKTPAEKEHACFPGLKQNYGGFLTVLVIGFFIHI